jgi:uncharacterized RDD family membrane protein YckC
MNLMEMQTGNNHSEELQSIFSEEDIYRYEYASTGQRFLNYLIDFLFLRFVVDAAVGFIIGFVIKLLFPDVRESIGAVSETTLILVGLAVWLITFVAYYTFSEKWFKGYTLGKLITGTRAVRSDGSTLTWENAFLRSISRIVPFEPLSGFGGHPWHDQWTKTMVIKSRN